LIVTVIWLVWQGNIRIDLIRLQAVHGNVTAIFGGNIPANVMTIKESP